jgi:hypothetical protein
MMISARVALAIDKRRGYCLAPLLVRADQCN